MNYFQNPGGDWPLNILGGMAETPPEVTRMRWVTFESAQSAAAVLIQCDARLDSLRPTADDEVVSPREARLLFYSARL